MVKNNRIILIDGNAIIHRAFHALPPLTTKSGELVNAVYGFTNILLKAIKDLDPAYCAVAFDLPAPTFRHTIYKEYKATRVKADQGLYDQIPRIKQVVETLNLPIYEKEGFEADDVIGTLAYQSKKLNLETIIVTGDLDTLQLVSGLTKVYTMRKGFTDTVIYDSEAVQDRYGLTPEQFTDYKALRGDSSDNIPGIPGIGEKGATNLLQKYENIDGVMTHLNELPERISNSLKENQKQLELNKQLVKIICDVPIELHLTSCKVDDYDREKIFALFQELEFKSLLSKLPKPQIPVQNDLFSTDSVKKHPHFSHKIITSSKELDSLCLKLSTSPAIVLDTEQDHLNGNLIGISLAVDSHEAFYIPMDHINCPNHQCLSRKTILDSLKPIFEQENIKKIGHNIKYDYTNLCKYGIRIKGIHFDTMIASYILNPGSRSHGLDAASFVELGMEKIPLSSLIGEKKLASVAEAPLDQVAIYSCEDAHCTYKLWQKFAPLLDTDKQKKLFYEIEIPLISILADMEIAGIKIDTNHLRKLQETLSKRILELENEIHNLCGLTFNVASPKQISDVLFNQLKLSSAEIKKGKTGISTAAGELEKLKGAHPVIEKILEHRELNKLLNTYIEALPKLVDKEDRLHTNFNQTITSTGRLSSSEPNLQNIPIRTELGQQIRRAFVAKDNFMLISADYSQIELRVMAELSHDTAMISAFKDGRDIHGETSKRLGIDRRMAKVVNFSIIYGTSAFGLAQDLDIDTHQAKELIDHYFASYPSIKKYMLDTVSKAKQDGYTETFFGRRRFLPEIYSSNVSVRNAAERAAINMPVQGTAADIMKIAMININTYLASKTDSRFLLQVHDEVILEVPVNEAPEISQKIKEIMENACHFEVPLVAEASYGVSWGELKPSNKKAGETP